MDTFIIAIDGTCASGKGTIAEKLAQILGYKHFSTGYVYRGLAYFARLNNIAYDDFDALVELAHNMTWDMISPLIEKNNLLEGRLETLEIGQSSSIVSSNGQVREALINMQRGLVANCKGAIIDGRDIGTIIFPDANCKFFIDADVNVRAMRRYKQIIEKKVQQNINNTYDHILKEIIKRDARDSNRSVAPLKPSVDAHVINTTNMTIDECCDKLLSYL